MHVSVKGGAMHVSVKGGAMYGAHSSYHEFKCGTQAIAQSCVKGTDIEVCTHRCMHNVYQIYVRIS